MNICHNNSGTACNLINIHVLPSLLNHLSLLVSPHSLFIFNIFRAHHLLLLAIWYSTYFCRLLHNCKLTTMLLLLDCVVVLECLWLGCCLQITQWSFYCILCRNQLWLLLLKVICSFLCKLWLISLPNSFTCCHNVLAFQLCLDIFWVVIFTTFLATWGDHNSCFIIFMPRFSAKKIWAPFSQEADSKYL